MNIQKQTKQISFGDAILLIAVLIIVLLIVAFVTQICWNASMPKIFNVPEINFITALALLILVSLLFKSSDITYNFYCSE